MTANSRLRKTPFRFCRARRLRYFIACALFRMSLTSSMLTASAMACFALSKSTKSTIKPFQLLCFQTLDDAGKDQEEMPVS